MATSIDAQRRSGEMLALCREILAQHPLIVVSNRGPVEYNLTPEGHLQPRRRSGAVSTALNSLIANLDFHWVTSAMGEGDRRVVEQAGGASVKPGLPNFHPNMRFVVTPRRAYHKFYNIFCNPLLWFLQHYLWNAPYTPNIDSSVYDAWDTGYVVVNQSFADAVIASAQEASPSPLVMLHDYHLYLVPEMVRKQVPRALFHYLVHIPWPTPHVWQLLPASMRTAICRGLCACDIVGFQSELDGHNFLECCRWFVPGAHVDFAKNSVRVEDHTTLVRCYPLSIDVAEIQQIASSPRALDYERRLKALCTESTIVRVDRAEPNKNIVRGFRAYQLMLERHPDLRGRVKFLAFLVPSRTHIKQYERYLQEIDLTVQEINKSLGTPEWQPIHAFYENNYLQAIAGLRLCDVLLVNPVADGMNLVAKEGPIVSTKDAVLILSDGATAYEQLKDSVLAIAPADLEITQEALYKAITMPKDERERRSASLRSAIAEQDSTHWLLQQFIDIQALVNNGLPGR